MISGTCRTNLDGYDTEIWPHGFVAVPREGEYVKSKGGKILKVCRVTHIWSGRRSYNDDGRNDNPLIEVELTR